MSERTIFVDGSHTLFGLRLSSGVQSYPNDLCWMHVRYRQDKNSSGRILAATVVDLHYNIPGDPKVVASQQLKWLNTMLDHNCPAIFQQIIAYIREIDRMEEGEIFGIKVLSLMPENYAAVMRMLSLRDDGMWTDLKHPG